MRQELASIAGVEMRIFMSYRRRDGAGHAHHLYADLHRRFGDAGIFMDNEIRPGSAFPEVLKRELEKATVMLVIVGPRWLQLFEDKVPEGGEMDFLKIELETALKRGIPIIPVLVDGAQMPSANALPETLRRVADCQASELTTRHWDQDVKVLTALPPMRSRKRLTLAVAVILMLVAAGGAAFHDQIKAFSARSWLVVQALASAVNRAASPRPTATTKKVPSPPRPAPEAATTAPQPANTPRFGITPKPIHPGADINYLIPPLRPPKPTPGPEEKDFDLTPRWIALARKDGKSYYWEVARPMALSREPWITIADPDLLKPGKYVIWLRTQSWTGPWKADDSAKPHSRMIESGEIVNITEIQHVSSTQYGAWCFGKIGPTK